MPLDPEVAEVLRRLALLKNPPIQTLTPAQARQAVLPATQPNQQVARTVDAVCPGAGGPIPVRVYLPWELQQTSEQRPLLLFFHGGGWMLSNLTVYEHLSRQLANAAGCVLVAVEYQLAPEARFPSQVEACYEATVWAAAQAAEWQADGSRIIVAGDSAGGNLAAAVALLARDRQAPQIDYQLLIYPVTDCRFDTESYLANAEGYLLTRAAMQWFWENYLPDVAAAENPLASPLRAEDLAGLPYTDLITAEYDPLRDEGEAYAHKLTAAGVPVRLERFEGMIHGFVRWTDVFTRAHAAIAEMGQRIRAHFGLPDAVPVPLQNS